MGGSGETSHMMHRVVFVLWPHDQLFRAGVKASPKNLIFLNNIPKAVLVAGGV